MPEGDTVWHTAAVLRDALVGQTLTECDVRVPRVATVDLTGHVVDEVLSRGKHLFLRVGSTSIHAHLKMEGSWRVTTRAPRTDHRVRIILSAGAVHAVGVSLGLLEMLPRDTDLAAVAHLGPDLLGNDWDPQVAARNLMSDPLRPLGQVLLDQTVMAGIGNVYSNELCFLRGIDPSAPVSRETDPLRLVSQAHRLLWANRSRWSRCTTGDTRRGRRLWVYGRAGLPCRRCGSLLDSADAGGRINVWCGHCQR